MNHDELRLDYESVYENIQSILDDVRAMRVENRFITTFGKEFVERVKEQDTKIQKRMGDVFNLVVVGDFKRGKSTLINALLGMNILPTAATPETITFNMVSYASALSAEVVLKNGRRAFISYDALDRETIERKIKQLPAQIAYLDIKAGAEILREITIIDTPGVGEIMRIFDAQVVEFLANADAIIYVVSAEAPLSLSEQAFLSSSVLPHGFSHVLTVINKADILNTAETIARVKNSTAEKVADINESINVFILSALDEICRKQNLKRPAPGIEDLLAENFFAFENILRTDIIAQREIIKSTRGLKLTQAMLNEFFIRVTLVHNSLQVGIQKLVINITETKDQDAALVAIIGREKTNLSTAIVRMQSEALEWVRVFMHRIQEELCAIQESANVSDLQRYFQFYLMDLIKNAITICTESHQSEIAEQLSASAQEIAENVSLFVYGKIDSQIAGSIKDISWTVVDTAVYFGNFLNVKDLLGPFYIIGQAVTGFIRQAMIRKQQQKFLTPVLGEFDAIIQKVEENVKTVYEQLEQEALKKLDDVYQHQMQASAEAMEQAQAIINKEGERAEQVNEYMKALLREIQYLQERLQVYD